MNAPLALYRRYRPETYAEVIGQDHVTEPLRRALAGNRVNHAYLFSGPRGCGKTTSARILARCLNCEQGPTPDPCGTCQSCLDLARGGSGSIDVIEIDAASHGGVDDARDLRERAFFAPVSSRYKIYIVDEAHMVTTQGFNALLKLVEEPPEHLKFIFATTEPDKVIGTIRSRTHHYPFRLVPPKVLSDYLAELCEKEGVTVEPAALPLVVRAGGGSVRDTLSVLDQLIGGAGPDGVTYAHAAAILGYTHAALLDEVVEALAAHDGAAVFACVDKVIESGQDPKRFAEDLLHRLRDLVILATVPDAVSAGLVDGGPDEAERLAAQAARFGTAELTRAASEVNTGLTEMRGATAPRLHLELLCARVLLPGVDESRQGLAARLDRLERSLATGMIAGGPPAGPGEATPAAGQEAQQGGPAPVQSPARPQHPPAYPSGPEPGAEAPTSGGSPAPSPAERPAVQQPQHTSQQRAGLEHAGPRPQDAQQRPTGQQHAADAQPAAQAPSSAPSPSAGGSAAPGELGLADVRRAWPAVLDAVKDRRRLTWSLLSHNAQVTGLHAGVLTVALVNAGARDSFARSGSEEILREGLRQVLGVDWRVEAIVDPAAGGSGPSGQGRSGGPQGGGSPRGPGGGGSYGGSGGSRPPRSDSGAQGNGWDAAPQPSTAAGTESTPTERSAPPSGHPGASASASGGSRSGSPPGAPAGSPEVTWPAASPAGGPAMQSPSEAGRQPPPRGTGSHPSSTSAPPANTSANMSAGGSADVPEEPVHDPDADVDPETDAVATEAPDTHKDLLVREFGAEIVEEIRTE